MKIVALAVLVSVTALLTAGCGSLRAGADDDQVVIPGPPADFSGTWTVRDAEGRVTYEAEYLNGDQHGSETTWYPNGNRESEHNYVVGRREGKYIYWHENGRRKEEGFLLRDPESPGDLLQHGVRTKWTETGRIRKIEYYDHGTRVGRR